MKNSQTGILDEGHDEGESEEDQGTLHGEPRERRLTQLTHCGRTGKRERGTTAPVEGRRLRHGVEGENNERRKRGSRNEEESVTEGKTTPQTKGRSRQGRREANRWRRGRRKAAEREKRSFGPYSAKKRAWGNFTSRPKTAEGRDRGLIWSLGG